MTDLEKRVTNLELALYSTWHLLEQNEVEAVKRMLKAHFDASTSLGGFRVPDSNDFYKRDE